MSFFGLIRLNFGFRKVICCLYHSGTVGILRLINRINNTLYFSINIIYILQPKNYTLIEHENIIFMQHVA